MITTTLKIGRKTVNKNDSFIIAEVGVNHNGKVALALKLIDEAAHAGADAVKFQTFRAADVTTNRAKTAAYQRRRAPNLQTQLLLLKKLELQEKFYPKIIARCRQKKIIFLSTPHGGFASVDFLEKLHVPAFKFGSGDLTNLPLLEYAARLKKPMIVSTGMANLAEIKTAIKTIKKAGNNQIIALHCTSSYPCPDNEVNLKAMLTMMEKLPIPIGYSDHTAGILVPIMAATLGACIIEKHFTLDKNLPGPDHRASLKPRELQTMIEQIKKIPLLLGSSTKQPTADEITMRTLVRKSVVSTCPIRKGEKFTTENLGIKRPGTGLTPRYYPKILKRKAKRNLPSDVLIRLNDLA